jgi:hypothetical protein
MMQLLVVRQPRRPVAGDGRSVLEPKEAVDRIVATLRESLPAGG